MLQYETMGEVDKSPRTEWRSGTDKCPQLIASSRVAKWNGYSKESPPLTASVQIDLATVAFNNLLGDGQPEAATIWLPITNKRVKDGSMNPGWDPRTVIPDIDLQAGAAAPRGYQDLSRLRRNCLTSVQNQVCDCSLNPTGIKPT